MLRHLLLALLALICAGCAGLRPALDDAPPRGSLSSLEASATPFANALPTATGVPQAQMTQVPGGERMTQTMQTRGQFELVGGQGRIVNGFVRIPALVRNRSAEWADVVVAVELLDADGQALVNRAATNAGEQLRSAYAIPPGGTMYYLYLRDVERLNGQYASHRLTLSQAYTAAPAVRAEVSLASQTALKPAFDGAPAYLARGSATSATRCAEPLVVAAGFDAEGNLLDVAEALLYPKIGLREFGTDLSELTAGATGHFTLEFLVPGIQTVQAVAVYL